MNNCPKCGGKGWVRGVLGAHVNCPACSRLKDGMVDIEGDFHLFECEKRKDKNNPCNCGSTPVGSQSTQKTE